MTRSSRKVRLSDVARAADVSVATVSRLMRRTAYIDSATRERIVKAAKLLAFDLDSKANSKIIAFLLSNRGVLHPFHSAMLMGVEAYCAEHDFGLLFLRFNYSLSTPAKDLELPQILGRAGVVSGVIVAGTNSSSIMEILSRRRMPWVVLKNNVVGEWPPGQVGSVSFDDIGGAAELTRYLLSLGHCRVGFVGNMKLPWYLRRFQGYLQTMKEYGLEPRTSDLNYRDNEEMGYLATKILLKETPPITAVFAGDDAAARGAYKAAWDCGLRIPQDISIAGFNDTLDAAALLPPLTSMHVFTDELGRQSAELLLRQIAHPELPLGSTLLPTRLIRRESCAPPSLEQNNARDAAESSLPAVSS